MYYLEIGGLAKDVVGESIIISGLKGKTLRQPIQICTDSERWILYDGNEKEIGEKIKAFLEEHTIPLLNDLKGIEDYLKMFESNDDRIITDDRQHVYCSCAFALKGNYKKALEVLESRFSEKELQKQCDLLLKYLENNIQDTL